MDGAGPEASQDQGQGYGGGGTGYDYSSYNLGLQGVILFEVRSG